VDDSLEYRQAMSEGARLLSQNRPGEALEKLLPLYESLPDDPDLAINIGGAYILQRKYDRAAGILRKAAEQFPENAALWSNLAASELGGLEIAGPAQQDKAIAAYERALEANPNADNVHYHLGLIYKERGELNRAAAFFQRALEVDPNDKDAAYWLNRMVADSQASVAARLEAETPQISDEAGLPESFMDDNSNEE
jgi:tetratricopeptide (TPR) repeat protein